MNNNIYQIRTKRIAPEITIESPIIASLKIEKRGKKLFAEVSFFNDGKEDVKLNVAQLGGDKLTQEVFFLKPFPSARNLTFSPYVPFFRNNNERYIVLKPKEQLVTTTELTKYYDLKERKYEKLYIVYSIKVQCVDEKDEPIMKCDKYGNTLPVVFFFWTKDVILSKDDINELL